MQKLVYTLTIFVFSLFVTSAVNAGGSAPGGLASEFTKLHLTINEESTSSKQDLNSLEPGLYEFNVTNETSEKVEFVIQDLKTDKVLAKLKIKPNKVKKSRVKITKNGFKYQKSNDVWNEFVVN